MNVSVAQFATPDLAPRWAAAVAAAGLPAAALRLEAPSEALALPCAPARLAALRAIGVGVLLDDAGPEDARLLGARGAGLVAVKLDHGRAADLATDATARARWHPLVADARARGLSVVAEGIATPAHRAGALAPGCDLGQGNLFGSALAELPPGRT